MSVTNSQRGCISLCHKLDVLSLEANIVYIQGQNFSFFLLPYLNPTHGKAPSPE